MNFNRQNAALHPRHISPRLADALADTPVVLINGARQSGKSTLVQSLADPAKGAPASATEPGIFQRGIVLYAGREIVPFGERLWAVPLSVWWAGVR